MSLGPAELHKIILAALKGAGVRPEIIYAFEKTGRVVTDENAGRLTPEERQAWDDAVQDYRRAHPEG